MKDYNGHFPGIEKNIKGENKMKIETIGSLMAKCEELDQQINNEKDRLERLETGGASDAPDRIQKNIDSLEKELTKTNNRLQKLFDAQDIEFNIQKKLESILFNAQETLTSVKNKFSEMLPSEKPSVLSMLEQNKKSVAKNNQDREKIMESRNKDNHERV